jgi:hypothetical protein
VYREGALVEVFHSPQLAVLRHNPFRLCGAKGVRVGRVLIDTDRERKPAVIGSHHLLKETFRCGNIAFRAEHEFDGWPFFVNCTVQIFTGLPDFDVGLVNPEGRTAHLQMLTHAFVDRRRITLDPTKDGRVIHGEPALAHHFLNIAVGKLVAATASNA